MYFEANFPHRIQFKVKTQQIKRYKITSLIMLDSQFWCIIARILDPVYIPRALTQEPASINCDDKPGDLFHSTDPHGKCPRPQRIQLKSWGGRGVEGEGEREEEWETQKQ